jgi:hypothetical protein
MRTRRLPLLVIAALLTLAVLLAGCGGGGGTTEATEPAEAAAAKPTLTKAELIRQGNDICGETNTAVGAVAGSAAETQTQITQTASLYTGMIESIQKLGQPKEMDGYSEFMGAAEELAKVEGEVKLAAEREDTEALGVAASESAPALEEFQSQAAIYGFADCSEGPHAPEAAATGEAGGEVPAEETEVPSGEVEEVVPEEVEEVAPEEEIVPEEEVEEVAPETGGAGGEIEEVAPETPVEESGESGGVGPG